MNKSDILLFLLGFLLPNNMLVWAWNALFKPRRPHPGKPRLISPRRYYAKFQSDPRTQYAYHRRMQIFWIIGFIPMNLLIGADIWAAATNRLALALVLNAVILAINTNDSQYANFATETGDAHAAYASIKADEIQAAQEAPAEPAPAAAVLPEWSLDV